MHVVKGNSIDHTGYACAQVALVKLFRAKWSAVEGTTASDAPFGIVAIPPSGTEGGPNLGAMNMAQTGSYGVLPNAAMPNTFIAETYDLNDPWGDKTCYGWQCCWNRYNKTACSANAARAGLAPDVCVNYCQQLQDTPVFMGGIHPRSKYQVGRRLAIASHSLVYGGSGPETGPVISGCEVVGSKITIHFNKTLLKGEKLQVKAYNRTAGVSGAAVLGNASFYCAESALRCKMVPGNSTRPEHCGSSLQEWYCPADEDANRFDPMLREGEEMERVAVSGVPPRNPYKNAWLVADVAAGADGASIVIDASVLNGTEPVAVKYAYDMPRTCCDTGSLLIGKSVGCALEACPVTTSPSRLVPNPFMVKITGGKCVCTAPQVC